MTAPVETAWVLDESGGGGGGGASADTGVAAGDATADDMAEDTSTGVADLDAWSLVVVIEVAAPAAADERSAASNPSASMRIRSCSTDWPSCISLKYFEYLGSLTTLGTPAPPGALDSVLLRAEEGVDGTWKSVPLSRTLPRRATAF